MEKTTNLDDRKKQDYNRQKELIKGKISELNKKLDQLEIDYQKQVLSDKIKNLSEVYNNLLPLEDFKRIHRNNS
jgi:hypothetical protein